LAGATCSKAKMASGSVSVAPQRTIKRTPYAHPAKHQDLAKLLLLLPRQMNLLLAQPLGLVDSVLAVDLLILKIGGRGAFNFGTAPAVALGAGFLFGGTGSVATDTASNSGSGFVFGGSSEAPRT
jgi:hypothetical protein